MKKGYKRHKLQQKLMTYLAYFGHDLESKKRVVGILAHVWRREPLLRNEAAPVGPAAPVQARRRRGDAPPHEDDLNMM